MNNYRVPKGKVLGLRTTPTNGVSTNDFVWPTQGYAAAPDWRNDDQPGGGLHALLWGEGDESHFSRVNTNFQVVEMDEKSVVDLGGKVKFPSCNVLYTGDEEGARRLLETARLPEPTPASTTPAETPTAPPAQQYAPERPVYQAMNTSSYTQTTYTAPVYSNTTPTPDPILAALLIGLAIVGVGGIAALALLFVGLAFAAALPVATALVYAWKFRSAIWHGALFLVDCVEATLRWPFVLAYRGLQMAVEATQAGPQAQSCVSMPESPGIEPALVMDLPIMVTDWPMRKMATVEVNRGNQ